MKNDTLPWDYDAWRTTPPEYIEAPEDKTDAEKTDAWALLLKLERSNLSDALVYSAVDEFEAAKDEDAFRWFNTKWSAVLHSRDIAEQVGLVLRYPEDANLRYAVTQNIFKFRRA